MKNVEELTEDALVYKIAIIQKLRTITKRGSLAGGFPTQPKPYDLMLKSGFLQYLNSNEIDLPHSLDCIEIKSGNNANNQVVKEVCLFAMNKMRWNREKTKDLYDVILEMMLNTTQHAYGANKNYDKWVLFVKFSRSNNSLEFVFLDKGFGIANTVRRDFIEVLRGIISTRSDSSLINSALNGEFRTETKEKHRGKGLPKIKHYITSGYIKNMHIVSNKAFISPFRKQDMNTDINGTLFYWEMRDEQ